MFSDFDVLAKCPDTCCARLRIFKLQSSKALLVYFLLLDLVEFEYYINIMSVGRPCRDAR
jgi:hypothetical protein